MKNGNYVHGYSGREAVRLADQANTLVSLLHKGTVYPAGAKVLEPGCGTGSQTITLAAASPHAHFTCTDISPASIAEAERKTRESGIRNASFQVADIFSLPFEDESFDHVFVCFVLEHLKDPAAALQSLKRVLKKGGSITVIEGDHGSTFFYPQSMEAQKAIACQVRLQEAMGGNPQIGREVYPLLLGAGFKRIRVRPKMVYAEGRDKGLAEGFTRKTFTAMIEGVRDSAVGEGLIDPQSFDRGIRDLHRAAEEDGVFCYTFFKGVAYK